MRSLKIHMKRFTVLNDAPPPTISPIRLGIAAQYRSAYMEAMRKAIIFIGGETDLASVSSDDLLDELRERGFTVTVVGQIIGLTVDSLGASGGLSTVHHGTSILDHIE
jgi:hypothetical protein